MSLSLILETFIHMLIITAAIVGNTLVIIIILRAFRRLRLPSKYLLVSMAISDLLLPLVNAPAAIAEAFASWDYSHTWCNVVAIPVCILADTTILHVTVIAVERYRAIRNPGMVRVVTFRWRQVAMLILLWLIPVITVLLGPLVVWESYSFTEQKPRCQAAFERGQRAVTYSAVVRVFIGVFPFTIICYCYLKILRTARNYARRTRVGVLNQNMPTQRQINDGRSSKMVAVILASFLTCYVPMLTTKICRTFLALDKMPKVWLLLTVSLPLLNSLCNPLVYCVTNATFRRELRRLVKMQCLLGKPQTTSEPVQHAA